jgi:hypothetical protein
MPVWEKNLPYRQKALEDLAAALNINSAYLWVSPTTNALSLKEEALAEPVASEVVAEQLDQELP